jgi:hypothetical protein
LEAHAGDKVIIPPNLYHLTINAGDESLLFSDVIPLPTRALYDAFSAMHGAAYLNTLDEGWIDNPFYESMGELQHWAVNTYPEVGLEPECPLFYLFSQMPDKLAWMTEPNKFGKVFPALWTVLKEVIAR